MTSPRLVAVPAAAPRTSSRFGRWFGRTILALGGWRMRGELPDLPRLVIIAAPHSSAWDAVWGLAAKLALGVDVRFMAKAELFSAPWSRPIGWLLRALGGLPVDRSARRGVVEQMAARFAADPTLWLAIAPEGTRRRVTRWKSGFWHIARAADVPVVCAYFHYPERIIGIGPALSMSADLEADMARVRAFYRPWIGKHRGTL